MSCALLCSLEFSDRVVFSPHFRFVCGCFAKPIHFVLPPACFSIFPLWIYLKVWSLVCCCSGALLVRFLFSGEVVSFPGFAFQVIDWYQALFVV